MVKNPKKPLVTVIIPTYNRGWIIEEAIDYAIEKGVIVIASAGNEGEYGMGWPGAYPEVISVGACGWSLA